MATASKAANSYFRDDEIEQELVAYVLRKNPMFVKRLQPEWFSTVVYQNVIRVVRDAKATLSQSVMMSELRNRKMIGKNEEEVYTVRLEQLYKTSVSKITEKAAEMTLTTVIHNYEGREIVNGINEIAKSIKSESLDRIKVRMKELGAGAQIPDAVISGDYLKSFDARYEQIIEKRKRRDSGEDVGITTGIRQFDAMTGGLMQSEFGLIAGQPGVGKSATLVSFGLHSWRNGKNVLYVSGEMPKIDVEYRADADVAGISATKFRLGNFTDEELTKWRKAIDKQRDLRSSFFEVVSFPRGFCASDIEGHVLQLQDQYEQQVDLICLDYLNIMQANREAGGDHWRSQMDVVWDVKELTAKLNGGISLWTAGQVKDEAVDAEVLDLSMVKYGRALSEAAPVVIGLVRTMDEDAEMVLEMQVLKMRNAALPDKSIILHPDMEYMRIHSETLPVDKDLTKINIDVKAMARKTKKGRR